MPELNDILNLLYAAVDELNGQNSPEQQLKKTPETVLALSIKRLSLKNVFYIKKTPQ